MFYIGNLIIMLALKVASEPVYRLFTHGPSAANIFALIYSGFLLTYGSKLVKRGFSREHTKSFFGQYFGTVLCLIALFNCVAFMNHMTLYSILRVASYLVPGILICMYNKGSQYKRPQYFEIIEEPEIEVIPEPVEVEPINDIDRVLFNISRAKRTNEAFRNPIFMENLKRSEAFLVGLKDNEYSVNTYIIQQINELLNIYLDLQGQYIQTEKTRALLNKVVESFGMISKSLETMYDNSFEDKAYSIESDIKTLELKLRSEGLLGSDFEIRK